MKQEQKERKEERKEQKRKEKKNVVASTCLRKYVIRVQTRFIIFSEN